MDWVTFIVILYFISIIFACLGVNLENKKLAGEFLYLSICFTGLIGVLGCLVK